MTPRYALFTTLAMTVALAPVHAQTKTVGTLSLVRHVEVTHTRTTPEIRERVERMVAKQGEPVFVEQGIVTHKRALAELALGDLTFRLNERSEAILSEARALWLQAGTVWVQDRGKGVRVDTPAGTVTATGATFEVRLLSPTELVVRCLDGSLEVGRNGRTARASAGENQHLSLSGSSLSIESVEEVKNTAPWWKGIDEERGLLVVPGSAAGFALRTSALAESIQATRNLPPRSRDIVYNAADKARLLAIAQSAVVPSIERTLATETTLTLAGYRQKYGGADLLQQYTLNSSDLGFLRANGISRVGELFDALNAVGGSFGIDIRSVHPTRLAYRPSAWKGAGSTSTSLIDGTKTSGGIVALGVVAAALLDGRSKPTDTRYAAEAFGFTSDPQALGGRVQLSGGIGKTRYQVEGNLLRLLSGSNTENSTALSVAAVERDMGGGNSVFIGRRRFYAGPVLQGLEQSQLIGDRYTSIGGTARRGEWQLQGAYLYDANPDIRGVQSGFQANASRRVGGGTLGFQVLHAGGLDSGTGFSVSGSIPATVGQLDLYGELGVAPDKAAIGTIGAYFPAFFEKWDTDLFVEYSSHEGLGKSLLATASRTMTSALQLRAFVGYGRRAFRTSDGAFGGVGVSFRIGS